MASSVVSETVRLLGGLHGPEEGRSRWPLTITLHCCQSHRTSTVPPGARASAHAGHGTALSHPAASPPWGLRALGPRVTAWDPLGAAAQPRWLPLLCRRPGRSPQLPLLSPRWFLPPAPPKWALLLTGPTEHQGPPPRGPHLLPPVPTAPFWAPGHAHPGPGGQAARRFFCPL